MRAIKTFLFLLLSLVLLAGCQGKALPDGMEERTLLNAGRDVMLLVVEGAYDEVWDCLRADVAETVTPEDIANLAHAQLDGSGDYRQIDGSMTTSQTSDGETYGVAVLYCEFSKNDILFRLAFDPNMSLIGLNIQKQ